MNKVLLLIFGLICFTTSSIFAHGGSHTPGPAIKAEKAKIIAAKAVKKLIATNKLDSAWKDIKANEPTQKSFSHGPEWVVTFNNPSSAKKEQQKLFVFVTLQGKVSGANFSGN